MRDDIRENRQTLKELFDQVIATNDQGIALPLDGAFEDTIEMIIHQAKKGGKLFFIGNGASASIASHMATDFWKNGGIPALAFNDSSLLTCISNDYGYPYVFQKPLEMFADAKDILFAISSSGKSENIVRAASAAKARGLKVVSLSGFKETNPLRKLGDINFYVPIAEYGHVEVMHSYICHCLVDVIIKNKAMLRERIECNE